MKEKIVIRDLKAASRSLLKGNWKKGVIINLIFFGILFGTGILRGIIEFGADAISDADAIVYPLVVSIVVGFIAVGIYNGAILGWTASFYRYVNGESELSYRNYKEFIADRFQKSFFYGVAYSFFIAMWTFGFYIVGIICMILISKTDSDILALLLLIVGSIAFVCGVFICIVKYIEYSMARYLIIDRPDIRVREALKESKRLIHGYKGSYFVMCISFVGWVILATLTFGIGGLWVGSYLITTEALFYKKLKEIKETLNTPSDKSSVDIDAFMTGVEIK